jgi:hypothetical protein
MTEKPEPRDWKAFRQARKNHKPKRLEKGQREKQVATANPNAPTLEYKSCPTIPRLNPAQQRELKLTGRVILKA